MTLEAARVAITTQFELALAAYSGTAPKVQYPNRNLIDPSTQVAPWVELDIVNISGKQLDLGPAPLAAQYGQIVLVAYAKENAGSKEAGMLLDYFLPWLERKNLGIVRTQVGMYSKSNVAKGWEGFPIVVPFWWLRVAT